LPSAKLSDDAICSELKTKFGIHDYYYRGTSFELEVPGQLEGEVQKIREHLQQAHIEPTTGNIYEVLSIKSQLIQQYSQNTGQISRYREYIADRIKPVGAVVPVEYVLATIAVYIALTWLRSFLEEAGRISARTLFERQSDRDISQKTKCNVAEVRLARPDAVVVFYRLKRSLLNRKKRRAPRSRSHKKLRI